MKNLLIRISHCFFHFQKSMAQNLVVRISSFSDDCELPDCKIHSQEYPLVNSQLIAINSIIFIKVSNFFNELNCWKLMYYSKLRIENFCFFSFQ